MILSRTTFHLVRVKWNSSDFKDYVGSMWGPVGQAETRKPASQSHKGARGRMNRGFSLWDCRPTDSHKSHKTKREEAD